MRVFISFSGDRSAKVAGTFREWLPRVIQATRPWMSHSDMEKGVHWYEVLTNILADAAMGIICVTPENVNSPWLAFEAGALSMKFGAARVCTYLFDVKPANVPFPLAMFHHTQANKDDTRKLIWTINAGMKEEIRLTESLLDASFEEWWPSLEKALETIPTALVADKSVRPDRELLEELVALMRVQANERQDHEMLARIQAFRSVVTETALTIKQFTRTPTPETQERARTLRAELEEGINSFTNLIKMMDHPSSQGGSIVELPPLLKEP